MTDQTYIPSYSDVFAMILRRWLLFIGITALCFVLAVVFLQFSTRAYTIEMIIGPTASDGVAGRGARLTLQSPDEQLIRHAPIEMDKDESLSDFSRFIELMTSKEISERLIKQVNIDLLKRVFPDQWNERRNNWQPPQSLSQRLVRFLNWLGRGGDTWEPPNAVSLSDHLSQSMRIEPVGTSAMRRVVYRHPDRVFGIQLLNAVYQATDDYLRDQAKQRTEAEIAYIDQALQRVRLVEHRRALTNLLASQEQTQMMISVDLPFAADQIEASHAHSIPNWPPVIPVFILSLIVGGLLAVIVIYILETRKYGDS